MPYGKSYIPKKKKTTKKKATTKRHEVKTHLVKGKNGTSVRVKHPRGKGGGTKKKSKVKKPGERNKERLKKLEEIVKKVDAGIKITAEERDFFEEMGKKYGSMKKPKKTASRKIKKADADTKYKRNHRIF
jgi:hypothetical protein